LRARSGGEQGVSAIGGELFFGDRFHNNLFY
jgi:hypothetical protein